MAKQIIPVKMWPVNSQGTPIVNTVTYPERSVTLVDGVYQARIQKPGTGQVIQVKLNQQITNQFKIRLVRGDETLVTEALLTYIKIKKSTRAYQTITYTFDSLTGYWTITSGQDFDDANGYWLEYLCSDGILTQYPYKYKTADKNNTSNLQSPGTYQDIIPYWNITETYSPNMDDISTMDNVNWWVVPGNGLAKGSIRTVPLIYVYKTGLFRKIKTIKSSIPYKIDYQLSGAFSSNYWAKEFFEVLVNDCGLGELWSTAVYDSSGVCVNTGQIGCFNERPFVLSSQDNYSEMTVTDDASSLYELSPYDLSTTTPLWTKDCEENISGAIHYLEVSNTSPDGTWHGDVYTSFAEDCEIMDGAEETVPVMPIYLHYPIASLVINPYYDF